MYSTKHRQSPKRSTRDSDLTNQHQPSLSVTPMVPQQGSHTYQRRLPFDGNPSLSWRRPAKRVSQPSQASSRARTTGSISGKRSGSAKSNRGTETTCAVLACADARPWRTCRVPEVQGRRWQPLPVSTQAHHTLAHEQWQICKWLRLRHDKRTSSSNVHYPDGPSTHLPTSLSFLKCRKRLEKRVSQASQASSMAKTTRSWTPLDMSITNTALGLHHPERVLVCRRISSSRAQSRGWRALLQSGATADALCTHPHRFLRWSAESCGTHGRKVAPHQILNENHWNLPALPHQHKAPPGIHVLTAFQDLHDGVARNLQNKEHPTHPFAKKGNSRCGVLGLRSEVACASRHSSQRLRLLKAS